MKSSKMMRANTGSSVSSNKKYSNHVTIQRNHDNQVNIINAENSHQKTDDNVSSCENVNILATSPNISWCPKPQDDNLNFRELRDQLVIVKKPAKTNIFEHADYIELRQLRDLVSSKTIFDHYSLAEIQDARNRCNPYERIGSGIFMNRAAMKLAEIDSTFGSLITQPECWNQQVSNSPLYFADLCGGHGGFSEYILWRTGWMGKGFGFTLTGKDDFKPHYFIEGSIDTFKAFYGADNDGDITKVQNITSFKKDVMNGTEGQGVHCVVSDGGFSVAGNENEQEILSKELYLCQIVCALSILREGGNFVCKLFDVYTAFSASLLFLVRRAFRDMGIVKPLTSRPANGERYLVCRGRLSCEEVDQVCSFLVHSTAVLQERSKNGFDISSLVPRHVVDSDPGYLSFITGLIEKLADKQKRHLVSLRSYVENKAMAVQNQAEIRKELLDAWKIPDRGRKWHSRVSGRAVPTNLVNEFELLMYLRASAVVKSELSIYDLTETDLLASEEQKKYTGLRFVISLGPLEWILGCGGSNVYRSAVNQSTGNAVFFTRHWTPYNDNASDSSNLLLLPKSTLLLTERVTELTNNPHVTKTMVASTVNYVLDAFMIGGENIIGNSDSTKSHSLLVERRSQVRTLLKSLHATPLHIHELLRQKNLRSVMKRLVYRNDGQLMAKIRHGVYVCPTGIRIVDLAFNQAPPVEIRVPANCLCQDENRRRRFSRTNDSGPDSTTIVNAPVQTTLLQRC